MDTKSIMKDKSNSPPATDINQRIARRVSALRAESNMSLEALANKCDVSRSMISLIERGEASPTAVVLDKLAFGLGVTLAWFFEESQTDASPLSRRAEQLEWTDPESGYTRRNLSPPHFRSGIQMVEVVFPAGARVAYQAGLREHGLQQQVWLLDGCMELTVGGVHHHLQPGDCLAMHENHSIIYQNTSKLPARYLVAINNDFPPSSRR